MIRLILILAIACIAGCANTSPQQSKASDDEAIYAKQNDIYSISVKREVDGELVYYTKFYSRNEPEVDGRGNVYFVNIDTGSSLRISYKFDTLIQQVDRVILVD